MWYHLNIERFKFAFSICFLRRIMQKAFALKIEIYTRSFVIFSLVWVTQLVMSRSVLIRSRSKNCAKCNNTMRHWITVLDIQEWALLDHVPQTRGQSKCNYLLFVLVLFERKTNRRHRFHSPAHSSSSQTAPRCTKPQWSHTISRL